MKRRFAVAIMATKTELGKTGYNARCYIIEAATSAEALGLGIMRRNKEDDWNIFTYAVTEIVSEMEELEREIG